MARAYMAIAKGYPGVVPSVEAMSLLTVINSLTGAW